MPWVLIAMMRKVKGGICGGRHELQLSNNGLGRGYDPRPGRYSLVVGCASRNGAYENVVVVSWYGTDCTRRASSTMMIDCIFDLWLAAVGSVRWFWRREDSVVARLFPLVTV